MITSVLSIPCRYTDVTPRSAWPSWRWMTFRGTPVIALDGFGSELREGLTNLVSHGRELALGIRTPQQRVRVGPFRIRLRVFCAEPLGIQESPELRFLPRGWLALARLRLVLVALRR